jgi:hypothetical protein
MEDRPSLSTVLIFWTESQNVLPYLRKCLKNVGTDPGIAAAFVRQLDLERFRGSVPIFFSPYGVKNSVPTFFRLHSRVKPRDFLIRIVEL